MEDIIQDLGMWKVIGAAAIVAFIFILPTLIAIVRRHANLWMIIAANLGALLTWIGWFAVLVWAVRGTPYVRGTRWVDDPATTEPLKKTAPPDARGFARKPDTEVTDQAKRN